MDRYWLGSPLMAAELSDAEVFGTTTSAPPAAPREMSDAEVFGPGSWAATTAREGSPEELPPTFGWQTLGLQEARFPGPGLEEVPIEGSRYTGKNPAFALGDPRESLAPTTIEPGRLASAAAEGWRATPSILTPEGQDVINEMGPLGRQIVNPALKILNIPVAAANALMYGGAELANQLTGDPRAGRDALMLAQVAPMAKGGFATPEAFSVAPDAAPAPRPQYASERFAPDVSELDPYHAIGALIRHDIQENPPAAPPLVSPMMKRFEQETAERTTTPATQEPPAPGHAATSAQAQAGEPVANVAQYVDDYIAGKGRDDPRYEQFAANNAPEIEAEFQRRAAASPGPRSVGAAASRDMTDPAYLAAKTPAQALNDFRTSVTQTARDRASPGAAPGTVEDHTVYVPDVTRLESARVFDPEVAGNHDVMRDIDPAYKTAADAVEQQNHDILKETFLRQAGDANSVDALREAQRQVSPEALGVFQNERPVSAQPVLDTIRDIMASPAGKVEAVQSVMRKVERGLYDANGNLETLPSQLYGARRNLTSILNAKGMTSEASDAATARHELNTVLPVLDRVIGQGADGFSDVYLPQWADYARQIDQQNYLQGKTLGAGKVTGADGNLTANGMQKLLEQIAVDKGKPGNNPAKTLTEDQLNNLIAIRNELAAMQLRDQLAKSSGSPTVKKAAAAARLGNPVLNAARETAIHGVLAKTTGGAGNVIYQLGVKPVLEKRRERKAEAVMTTTRNRLLNTSIPTE